MTRHSIMCISIGMASCGSCLEQGHVFQVKVGERLLYFQADLKRDTDRIFTAIESASKVWDNCFIFISLCEKEKYVEKNDLILIFYWRLIIFGYWWFYFRCKNKSAANIFVCKNHTMKASSRFLYLLQQN